MFFILVVVVEFDWMKDRVIVYVEVLRKVGVDVLVLEYKDVVYEFVMFDLLVKLR